MEKMMIDEFIRYAKEEYGVEISLEKSGHPDTFEDLFGGSFAYYSEEFFSEIDDIANVEYENLCVEIELENMQVESAEWYETVGFAA